MLQQMLRDVMLKSMGYEESPYTDIMKSLEEVQEKLENQKKPIDWSFVRMHLGVMAISKRNSPFFYEVLSLITHLFDAHQCKDFSVIADAFQLQCFVFEYSTDSFKKARLMADMMKMNISCFKTDGLNFVSELMRMPYKSNTSSYVLMYDVIQMYLISVEDSLLKQLLEYGVMYIKLSDHRSTWSHCRQRMSILLDGPEKPMLLNSRTIQANFRALHEESRRRMLAVWRGVEVILKARVPENCAIDFGLCFRMAYETIPEPIITSQEVVAFLKLVLSGSSADALIQSIGQDYKKLFPESLESRTPRSLKHLCRCQVRQNLRQAGTYPFGIFDLAIPSSIKNYIHTVQNNYMRSQYNSYGA